MMYACCSPPIPGWPPEKWAESPAGESCPGWCLSLRLAGTRGPGASVLVFDEIDSGIGGATALAMGRKLAALSNERQVLCVTHLPQVAAFAETHYVIEREGATAAVRLVEDGERTDRPRPDAGRSARLRTGREAAAELLALAARLTEARVRPDPVLARRTVPCPIVSRRTGVLTSELWTRSLSSRTGRLPGWS